MVWNKSAIYLAIFSVATLSLNLSPSKLPARAQVSSEENLENQVNPQVTFEPPGDTTLERSQGGASRDSGSCPNDRLNSDRFLLPLMPGNSEQGFTVSDRPSFFVYVPSTSAEQIFFTLKDKNEEYYHQDTVTIPENGGIISIPLPKDADELEIGKNYQWTFVLACQIPMRPDSPMISGLVKRVEHQSVGIAEVDSTPSLEMAKLYGSAGIWFDTLKTLAQLRHQRPEDYTATWENFLNDVGLETISTKPLILPEN